MKYTKIVCTIGPASDTVPMLKKLIHAGMNVARLNFSHGTYEHHAHLISRIRRAAKECKTTIGIIQDLQGPRIRIGEILEQGIELKEGDHVSIVPQAQYHERKEYTVLPTHFKDLYRSVKSGHHILIADGEIDLKVTRMTGVEIHTTVTSGGIVKSHKGINVPGASFSVPSITEKDKKDILFGIEHGVDFIALSFVRTANDINVLRTFLKHLEKKNSYAKRVGIIAKIERPEAVEYFDDILECVDAIMIARGDLGIEVPPEHVPIIQKQLIHKCMYVGKPVIVATQMMESMISHRRPTRAEVSDVSNAVMDHTDAVMLSGESAAGRYPLEAVQMMARTIHRTEISLFDNYICENIVKEKDPLRVIGHVVAIIALTKLVHGIVVEDGNSQLAQEIAAHRPETKIIVFVSDSVTRNRLALVRGVWVFSHQRDIRKFLISEKIGKNGEEFLFVQKESITIKKI